LLFLAVRDILKQNWIVPRLKGEIPDFKKVKPSLAMSWLAKVFCFIGMGGNDETEACFFM
jgi:hypothetical protein